MVQIAGRYEVVDSQNFKEFLIKGGLAEDKAQQANEFKSVLEISVDGKRVTLKSDGKLGTHVTELVLDAEVEEKWPNLTVKSVSTLSGNVIKVQSTLPDGTASGNRTYTFSDSGLEVVYTGKDDFTAKRIYKRL